MRAPLSLSLLGAALALPLFTGCGLCDRDTEADGFYEVATDCTGTLVHGTLQIGGSGEAPGSAALQSTTCTPSYAGPADGGVHDTREVSPDAGAAGAPDAGAPAPAFCRVETVTAVEQGSTCAETTAFNARALGLPSQVRVEGRRTFELHGEINGRYLDCTPERFGDERILMCRDFGRVTCVAVLENL